MMNIPVAKPFIDESDAQRAYDTILSGWVTQGPRVQEFEEKFASYVGSKYAIAVSNCTTALHLSLLFSGIGAGDEVICPSMSFIATANSISHAGATPVFAEVDPITYNLSIADVEKKITSKTKGILLVHQIGLPADIDAFQDLAKNRNLKLIEDAACAIGSAYKGKKIGNHSELVCFSFHPRKVITTGDGGMISTSSSEIAEKLKLLRQHCMSVNDRERHISTKVMQEEYNEIGFNYRMTDIQASIGIGQLEKLDWIISERRKIAFQYNSSLVNHPYIRVPLEEINYFTNYQSYSIYIKPECPYSRDEIMQKMLDNGIATRRGVMTSHREKAYSDKYGKISLPISEDASDRSMIIPLYVGMTELEIEYVTQTLLKILNN